MSLDASNNLTVTGNVTSNSRNLRAGSASAWANINGTLSGTIAPRASHNVSSVTKVGTGQYTFNLTSAMPDANYAVIGTCSPTDVNVGPSGSFSTTLMVSAINTNSFSVSTFGFEIYGASSIEGALVNPLYVGVS